MHPGLISYKSKKITCWFDNGYKLEKTDTEKLQSYIDDMYQVNKIKESIKMGTKRENGFLSIIILFMVYFKR